MPTYGLAESAVALAFPPVGRGPVVRSVARLAFEEENRATLADNDRTALHFVSVGAPLPGHEIRLVDREGADAADETLGRLLFRGPSCTSGYYHNPEATARLIGPGGWIDSGDLAFRSHGELFITGRAKDLIIKAGRRLVPQEIEEAAGSIDGIREGCVAAFGVVDERIGTERLIVLAESHATSAPERNRLADAVVARVSEVVGVPPDVVAIVAPGAVPKTPSGKIRHAAARASFETGHVAHAPRLPARLRIGMARVELHRRLVAARRRVLRALDVLYLLVVWAAAAVVLVPVFSVMLRLLSPGRPVRALGRIVSRIVLAVSGCRLVVEGRERLPRHGPLVLVCNHTLYADAPALMAALPIDFVFATMKEILTWPGVGTFVRRARDPLVDRWHPLQGVADTSTIEARLRAGETVLFFPEGTFTPAAGLRPFRMGAFESAVATASPVLPIALRGTRRLLRAGAYIPTSGRIDVWIGSPIVASGTGWASALALRDQATDAIAAHCGEPRLDMVPAAPVRSAVPSVPTSSARPQLPHGAVGRRAGERAQQ